MTIAINDQQGLQSSLEPTPSRTGNLMAKGTGKKAAIPGFDVAGKTGTAQKLNPVTKTYSQSAYISSFIGFVPADDPKLVILVMVDEPQGVYWGGEVAAPAFREIGQQVLRYMNVPSNNERIFVLDKA